MNINASYRLTLAVGVAVLLGLSACEETSSTTDPLPELDASAKEKADLAARELPDEDTMAQQLSTDPAVSARPWDPTRPLPVQDKLRTATHDHHLHVDWVVPSSFDTMVKGAGAIVRGRVVGRRFDAFRTEPQFKPEDPAPTGTEPSALTPITIVKIQVDSVLHKQKHAKTSSGADVGTGTIVELLVPGGLLDDGCVLEPSDGPLPTVGEQGLFFLGTLDAAAKTPVATRTKAGLYGLSGGLLGRGREVNGRVKTFAPAEVENDAPFRREKLEGRSPDEVAAEVRAALAR